MRKYPQKRCDRCERSTVRGSPDFFAAAILLTASIVFTYEVGLVTIRADRERAVELSALRTLEDFGSALKDTETGERGYLLLGEDAYLAPYTNGLSRVRTNEEALRELASTGQIPKEQVERVIRLTQQKLAELEHSIPRFLYL